MYKVEARMDKIIQSVIRKNINESENELGYWNRHWSNLIMYYQQNGIPMEIKSEWWKNLYNEMIVHYQIVLGGFGEKHICELGSGSGYASLLMAQKGAKVTLVDFAPNAKLYAEHICEFLNVHKENVDFLLADAFSPELNIDQYDVVWNCGVIEHYEWDKAVELIKIMMKHVKDGGEVMVTLPNLLSPELIYKMIIEGKGSEIYYTHRMLKSVMQEAGLSDVKVHPINYWVPSFLPSSFANSMRKVNLCKYCKGLAWLFNGIGIKR